MHNALQQVSVDIPNNQIYGFSISGLATYMQMPELDICFDMGECPLSAVKLNHVFLSHAHGDHSRCLMRHNSLRRMMGIEKPSVYYMPEYLVESAKNWIRAEAIFEGVKEERIKLPQIVGLNEGEDSIHLSYRKDLKVKAFEVKHSVPAQGFTIYDFKKKLKEEYHGKDPRELIELRESGVTLEKEVESPRVTFIGDCLSESLFDHPHIWESKILILESTFVEDDDLIMAKAKGHTHLQEIIEALEQFESTMKTKHLILKHFSMKYSREHVLRIIRNTVPDRFQDMIHVFV